MSVLMICVDSLAQCLASIMAEPAVCPCAMPGGQEVFAYYVALLLSSRRRRPKGGSHGLSDEVAGLVMGAAERLSAGPSTQAAQH
jgi:hypothetical protein